MIDKKQRENVEYFNYLGSMIDAKCTRGMKFRIVTAKAARNKKKTFVASKLDLNLRKKLINCYIQSTVFHAAETWTLRKVDQKWMQSFGMWCRRRMEKIT
jgi:hypothetical protein